MNAIFKEVVLQLQDLLNNGKCSCAGTLHYPCPRCRVSIDQSQQLLLKVYRQFPDLRAD